MLMSAVQLVDQIEPAERLTLIAENLRDGKPEAPVTVRNLLAWFGAGKRGYWIVKRIREALAAAGLQTNPDFHSQYIDAPVFFELVPDAGPGGTAAEEPVTVAEEECDPAASAPAMPSIGIADPTYRIGMLAAANRAPLRVKPDNAVEQAITLMLAHDYSQLPVMTNEFTVKGMISWRSLGTRWALNKEGTAVRDFLEDPPVISAERSIFVAITRIVEHGYILVRDSKNRITGIVTTSDLSVQFQLLTEPFLLLGEIENHIRWLMDGRFTKEELQQAKDPSDATRTIENVADLTFGEYIRLLQSPTMWSKLGVAIDRATFVRELETVREIRNDVMHFDPDGVPDQELETLRRIARFLQTLHSLRV
jgi:CBS domain-containing protein